jgi:hypothetical protein
MKKVLMAGAALSLMAGSNVWAACDVGPQGTILAGDSCTTVVDLTVAGRVQVANLADIIMAYTPGSGATGSDAFCVGTNSTTGAFLTLDSASAGASFDLELAGSTSIPYVVTLQAGTSAPITPTEAVPSPLAKADLSSLGCASDTVNIQVDVTDVAYLAADAGAFQDTLTLLVAPQ